MNEEDPRPRGPSRGRRGAGRLRRCPPDRADVLLLIEVADTSLGYDRRVKMPLYARHGVGEAWIVDIEHRQVRFYRKPQAEAYGDITATETPGVAAIEALPGVTVDLSGLFGWAVKHHPRG